MLAGELYRASDADVQGIMGRHNLRGAARVWG
jgi:hypothetical protein